MKTDNILSHNIYSQKFKDEFLVMASCLPDIHPKIIKQFCENWKNVVYFCLEQFHYNQLIAKLFDILAIGKTKKVGFITPDGSPHCVQMHYASKYLKRGLNKKVIFEHFVIDKDGEPYEINQKDIDRSNKLSLKGIKIK